MPRPKGSKNKSVKENKKDVCLYVRCTQEEKDKLIKLAEQEKLKVPKEKVERPQSEPRKKKGLSFKEKQLFEQVEREIADLEREKKELECLLSSGTLEQNELMEKSQRIGEVISLLDEKELIWLELSEKM